MRITSLKYNFSHLTIKTLSKINLNFQFQNFPFFYNDAKKKKNVGFMIIFNFIIASKIKQMKFWCIINYDKSN